MALPDISLVVAELGRSPLAKAETLIRSLGIGSQASFSRLVGRAGDEIVAIGRARARRYAASRDPRGIGRAIPLFRVDADGALARIATLRPFAPGGWYADDPATLPRWMRGADGNGTFGGLPHFLDDARPSGFAGSAFVRAHPELRLPDDPGRWSDDDCALALARSGDDVAGDLVMGEEPARRVYARRAANVAPVARSARSSAFPALAEAAIAGVAPGPSVGGEQPKFGAAVGDEASSVRVLVKFSPAEFSLSARRWCDLLVCEHLALEALRMHGLPAVESEIVEGGSRVFLQTTRYDRVGVHGRRAVVSLAAMNREYARMPSSGGGWPRVAERLASDRWLDAATVPRVRFLETFARFIANTDTDFANVSFFPRDDGRLELAPAYDMLPMAYAPIAGDLPERTYVAPPPDPGHEAIWREAGELAKAYWAAVAADERVSSSFRAIAAGNAGAVASALARFARPGSGP